MFFTLSIKLISVNSNLLATMYLLNCCHFSKLKSIIFFKMQFRGFSSNYYHYYFWPHVTLHNLMFVYLIWLIHTEILFPGINKQYIRKSINSHVYGQLYTYTLTLRTCNISQPYHRTSPVASVDHKILFCSSASPCHTVS